MIIDTHCHFDMMPNPEAYISAKEKVGDIVIEVTKILQKSGIQKNEVIELIYRGFI